MILIYGCLCALLCLRVVFYRRQGSQYRPLAALLAYAIAVASGTEALRAALGVLPTPSVADLVLHSVLLLALIASRGNVVELFHTSTAENAIYRLIRRTRHAQE
ncbi:MAG: phage holin family protein [Sterolibacterium sp.]|nr:phage holin family protein [Sterolibacterium sp.]